MQTATRSDDIRYCGGRWCPMAWLFLAWRRQTLFDFIPRIELSGQSPLIVRQPRIYFSNRYLQREGIKSPKATDSTGVDGAGTFNSSVIAKAKGFIAW